MPTYTPTAREAMVDVATAALAAGWTAGQTETSLYAVTASGRGLADAVADVVAEVYGRCPECGSYGLAVAFASTPNYRRCSLGHVFPVAVR